METLKYTIEDSTIAELLGVQNFTTSESAILEIIKNAYDAMATELEIIFADNSITFHDDGIGMNEDEIKNHWMHIGKSAKEYSLTDENKQSRVLAGEKGIGRFALARLGAVVRVETKKKGSPQIVWETDWNESKIYNEKMLSKNGTRITVQLLREVWNEKKVKALSNYISKTYNDAKMKISLTCNDDKKLIPPYLPDPVLGINCLSFIDLKFDSRTCMLSINIQSDEFTDEAKKHCTDIDINFYKCKSNMIHELVGAKDLALVENELKKHLEELGDFKASFFFNINSSPTEKDKFLYKYTNIQEPLEGGIILYRNAFSISSYEGKKDWLGLGKRSRKSPAAATHPSGSWRVRENQLAGKVEIDKKDNKYLQDLSNRQGLQENTTFNIFVEVILIGIKEFERYRQEIIRSINKKNTIIVEEKEKPLLEEFLENPDILPKFSKIQSKQLGTEISAFVSENIKRQKEQEETEKRYIYDVRILNVLATIGLKAAAIAHEMRNDRNTISLNCEYIISALKQLNMWDELNLPANTNKAHKNIPKLIKNNEQVNKKLLSFMDTMLSETEKNRFKSEKIDINLALQSVINNWTNDYSWINITLQKNDTISYNLSLDIMQVIFDNLILNSVQQNESRDTLSISIMVQRSDYGIEFTYADNGVGLPPKYKVNPNRILEVHESSREEGHGLGMWIVNNTILMTGGEVLEIKDKEGFFISFYIGGRGYE